MVTKSRVAGLGAAALLAPVVLLALGCGGNAMTMREVPGGPPPTVETVTFTRGLDETIGLQHDATLATTLADIDPKHIRHTDSMLVSFGTRNTLSDTMSTTRGIGAARRWIHSELSQYSRDCGGCLRVSYYGEVRTMRQRQGRDTILHTANVVDVLGWLPGRDTTHVVVITGHYDSCVCGEPGGTYDSTSTAPGADDDGSGTSAIVELARVFSKHYPKGLGASVIFAAVAGEEQGSIGAEELAQHLHDAGYKVLGGMTDDIVGNVTTEDGTTDSTSMRIFAADPDNSPSRELGRYAWAVNRLYLPNFQVLPVWRLDRIGRGGDHEPYINLGDPGLRFTERLEDYNRQHLPTDVFDHVNFGYVANVARENAATVGALAAAPPMPTDARATRQGRAGPAANGAAATATTSGGQAWTLSWDASPGATSYELLVRPTTAATWQQVIPLGNITTCTLKRQLDDEWDGIRAVGPHGERSLVASLPAPRLPRGMQPATRPAPARPAAARGPNGPPPPVCGG